MGLECTCVSRAGAALIRARRALLCRVLILARTLSWTQADDGSHINTLPLALLLALFSFIELAHWLTLNSGECK